MTPPYHIAYDIFINIYSSLSYFLKYFGYLPFESEQKRMGNLLNKLKSKAKTIKKEIYVLLAAYQHPELPKYIKLLTIGVISYAFSPIDLIPDFIPILGWIDEVVILPLAISFILKLIPDDIMHDSRKKATLYEGTGKKSWIAGAFIILVWLGLLFGGISLFF
jgi:uncharacterized membrane protein YkvA (DUF1232 family)